MKIRIKKLKEVDDPTHPNNIDEGFETTRIMNDDYFKKPTIGERFYVGWFSTSLVQEILTENTFKTLNSIYEWEILDPTRHLDMFPYTIEAIEKTLDELKEDGVDLSKLLLE